MHQCIQSGVSLSLSSFVSSFTQYNIFEIAIHLYIYERYPGVISETFYKEGALGAISESGWGLITARLTFLKMET